MNEDNDDTVKKSSRNDTSFIRKGEKIVATRTNFYYAFSIIIGILTVVSCAFFRVCFFYDSYYIQTLLDNWSLSPLKEFSFNKTCPEGYDAESIGQWPQSTEVCDCSSSYFYSDSFLEVHKVYYKPYSCGVILNIIGCKDTKLLNNIKIEKWREHSLCVKRINTTYYDLLINNAIRFSTKHLLENYYNIKENELIIQNSIDNKNSTLSEFVIDNFLNNFLLRETELNNGNSEVDLITNHTLHELTDKDSQLHNIKNRYNTKLKTQNNLKLKNQIKLRNSKKTLQQIKISLIKKPKKINRNTNSNNQVLEEQSSPKSDNKYSFHYFDCGQNPYIEDTLRNKLCIYNSESNNTEKNDYLLKNSKIGQESSLIGSKVFNVTIPAQASFSFDKENVDSITYSDVKNLFVKQFSLKKNNYLVRNFAVSSFLMTEFFPCTIYKNRPENINYIPLNRLYHFVKNIYIHLSNSISLSGYDKYNDIYGVNNGDLYSGNSAIVKEEDESIKYVNRKMSNEKLTSKAKIKDNKVKLNQINTNTAKNDNQTKSNDFISNLASSPVEEGLIFNNLKEDDNIANLDSNDCEFYLNSYYDKRLYVIDTSNFKNYIKGDIDNSVFSKKYDTTPSISKSKFLSSIGLSYSAKQALYLVSVPFTGWNFRVCSENLIKKTFIEDFLKVFYFNGNLSSDNQIKSMSINITDYESLFNVNSIFNQEDDPINIMRYISNNYSNLDDQLNTIAILKLTTTIYLIITMINYVIRSITTTSNSNDLNSSIAAQEEIVKPYIFNYFEIQGCKSMMILLLDLIFILCSIATIVLLVFTFNESLVMSNTIYQKLILQDCVDWIYLRRFNYLSESADEKRLFMSVILGLLLLEIFLIFKLMHLNYKIHQVRLSLPIIENDNVIASNQNNNDNNDNNNNNNNNNNDDRSDRNNEPNNHN